MRCDAMRCGTRRRGWRWGVEVEGRTQFAPSTTGRQAVRQARRQEQLGPGWVGCRESKKTKVRRMRRLYMQWEANAEQLDEVNAWASKEGRWGYMDVLGWEKGNGLIMGRQRQDIK